jgi:hypothetical protein
MATQTSLRRSAVTNMSSGVSNCMYHPDETNSYKMKLNDITGKVGIKEAVSPSKAVDPAKLSPSKEPKEIKATKVDEESKYRKQLQTQVEAKKMAIKKEKEKSKDKIAVGLQLGSMQKPEGVVSPIVIRGKTVMTLDDATTFNKQVAVNKATIQAMAKRPINVMGSPAKPQTAASPIKSEPLIPVEVPVKPVEEQKAQPQPTPAPAPQPIVPAEPQAAPAPAPVSAPAPEPTAAPAPVEPKVEAQAEVIEKSPKQGVKVKVVRQSQAMVESMGVKEEKAAKKKVAKQLREDLQRQMGESKSKKVKDQQIKIGKK